MALILRFFTCLILTAYIVASVDAAISCRIFLRQLAPCASYLWQGGKVIPSCCARIKRLNEMAQSTLDRQEVCKCLKAAAHSINLSRASSIPGKCGIRLPYLISVNTNCDIVQ